MTAQTFTLDVTPDSPALVITREFDAPREKVFAAHVDPEAIPLWWGPRGIQTVVESLDARHGGTWRFVQRGDDGEYGFRGVYHAANAPEELVYTFEFEGMPGHVLLETLTFEDLGDGRTRLTDVSVFQSVADRDGMVASGMESGARDSMDRLEELLAGS